MAEISEILGYISDKYKAEAEAIEKTAMAERELAMQDARAEAEAQAERIIAKANEKAAVILTEAQSSSGQIISNAVLAAKNRAIKDVIQKAKESILNLDASDYIALLDRLLERYHEDKEGEMLLCARDLEAVGKDLAEAAAKYKLTVSKETADISGGFILRYGKIEENCSIDAIFREKTEQLTDRISGVLFG